MTVGYPPTDSFSRPLWAELCQHFVSVPWWDVHQRRSLPSSQVQRWIFMGFLHIPFCSLCSAWFRNDGSEWQDTEGKPRVCGEVPLELQNDLRWWESQSLTAAKLCLALHRPIHITILQTYSRKIVAHIKEYVFIKITWIICRKLNFCYASMKLQTFGEKRLLSSLFFLFFLIKCFKK